MALNHQQQRIATFLAQGLKPAQISTIVGVSAGYISQLCSEEGPPEFRSFVQERAAVQQEKDSEEELITAKYLAVEHKLLNAMEVALVSAELPAITAALKAVADRQEKRAARKAGILVPGGMHNTQVNVTVLQLPSHAIPEYQVNGQGQVLAVDGQCLSPMTSNAVKTLFAARKQAGQYIMPQAEDIQGSVVDVMATQPSMGEQAMEAMPQDF